MQISEGRAALSRESLITLTALALLVAGCVMVLAPFVSALLWAVLLCFSTWRLYERLLTLLDGRSTLAALIMTLTLATVLLVPVAILTAQLGDNARNLARAVTRVVDEGLPAPPDWVVDVPVVGRFASDYWQSISAETQAAADTIRTTGAPPAADAEAPAADIADGQAVDEGRAPSGEAARTLEWLQRQAAPMTKWLLARGLAIGEVLLQLGLSVFTAFYLYRDGISVAARFRSGMEHVAGRRAHALIDLAARTVKGVVYGVLGTALAQGTVATVGFLIAGVPGPFLLGLLTSVISIIPNGPPLIWLPASLWLFHVGETGWAVFMLIYGVFVISGIDNIVKPLLISQGAELPFLLVLLGILGGILAFGFIGIFLGPTLLAVGFALLREWTRGTALRGPPAEDAPAAPAGER